MNIDGYEIGEIAYLRRGGPLWAAYDPQGCPVLISFHAPQEGKLLEKRWRQWASIDSPHVVSLHDVVRHEDGRWALVQERVEGESLALLLADGGMREKISRHRIYQGICEGVEALHRAGMIHGDLSPNNIIVAAGQRAVIIDLSDDPEALAGTEGWSATKNPSREADIDAVEKIREALLLAEGPGEIPDPATRLRLHASLPVTEVRVPSRRLSPLRFLLRGEKRPQRNRQSYVRRLPPASLIVMVSVLLVGAASIFATADQSSAGGLGTQETQSAVETQRRPNERDSNGATSASGVQGADNPQSQQSPHREDSGEKEHCAADEIAARIAQILNARDEAFNNVKAEGLGNYLAGELLANDTATIHQMKEHKVKVTGFHTVLETLSVHQCDEQGAQVELTVIQSQHQRCIADSCTEVPEGHAQHVLLDLQGSDLKGIRTQ